MCGLIAAGWCSDTRAETVEHGVIGRVACDRCHRVDGAVERPEKLQAASFSGEVAGPRGQIAAAGDGDVVLTDNDEYGPATGDIYGATLAAGAVEVQGPAASGEAYAAMVTQQPAADGNREHSAVQVGRDGHFGRPIGLDAVPISDASAFLDPTGVVADRNGRYTVAWRHCTCTAGTVRSRP